MTEEGRTVLEQRWEDPHGHPLEAPRVLGRNAIPILKKDFLCNCNKHDAHIGPIDRPLALDLGTSGLGHLAPGPKSVMIDSR